VEGLESKVSLEESFLFVFYLPPFFSLTPFWLDSLFFVLRFFLFLSIFFFLFLILSSSLSQRNVDNWLVRWLFTKYKRKELSFLFAPLLIISSREKTLFPESLRAKKAIAVDHG
jgi:hypothetical protein